MTSLKSRGSTFSPPPTTFRSAVERPAVHARPEARKAAPPPRDEFVREGNARNKPVLGGLESGVRRGVESAAQKGLEAATDGAKGLAELAAELEPFRSGLDSIVGQIDPAVHDNPGKLNQFILDAIKALGIDAKHIGDAMKYVDRLYAYNSGNTRLT